MAESIGVAVIGCGTVGGQVARMLIDDAELLAARSGVRLALRHAVDTNLEAPRKLGIDESLLRTDYREALADPDCPIVAELVGGTTIAKTIVERAIDAGKHVVTANKALLAHHGVELYARARAKGVCIAFEASCLGGVPVIGALTTGLLANDIEAFYGILNGTCNHVLTEMSENGASYADVLADAQRAGLAEADPSLDVKGIDTAHKLAILASLAFGKRIDFDAINIEGIDGIDPADVRYGSNLGYTIKLLAIAQRRNGRISLRVHPSFIHNQHPLARVRGPFNAISIFGHATGHTMYYGRGAGGRPTASAVLADMLDVALGNAPRRFATLGIWPDLAAPADQMPNAEVRSRYYLRVTSGDTPGVLAQIAAVLGRCQIGISSVLQQEHQAEGGNVPVVITTYQSIEGNMQKALGEIDALGAVAPPTVCIRIVEEHIEPKV